MTPEHLALSRDVDRVFRCCAGTRERFARLALEQPDTFAHLVSAIDTRDGEANFKFLAHLDDAIYDPTRVPTLSKYWWRRGVTREVAASMIVDRKAGRPVALPRWTSKDADVLRMAKFLEGFQARLRAEREAVAVSIAAAQAIANERAEAAERAAQDARNEIGLALDGDLLAEAFA